MDLLFLGTSAGVPTKARNVSATAVIEASGSHWYLVDCGEGTQHQLLHTPLSIRDLRAIFITHVHGDHCFGLPGLLASAGMSGRTQPLELILPAALHDWVRQGLVASDTFLPFELRLLAVEERVEWRNDTLQVTTVQLSHRVPSVGFVFTELNPEPRLDIPRLEAEGIPRGPLWGDLAKGMTAQHGGQLLNGNDYLRPSRPARRVIVCGDNDNPEPADRSCKGGGCAGARSHVHPGRGRAHRGHLRPQHRSSGGALCRSRRRAQPGADALQRPLPERPAAQPEYRQRA